MCIRDSEIGHLVLKHNYKKSMMTVKEREAEANKFAILLLAPAIVLHCCNAIKTNDIMTVSYTHLVSSTDLILICITSVLLCINEIQFIFKIIFYVIITCMISNEFCKIIIINLC